MSEYKRWRGSGFMHSVCLAYACRILSGFYRGELPVIGALVCWQETRRIRTGDKNDYQVEVGFHLSTTTKGAVRLYLTRKKGSILYKLRAADVFLNGKHFGSLRIESPTWKDHVEDTLYYEADSGNSWLIE